MCIRIIHQVTVYFTGNCVNASARRRVRSPVKGVGALTLRGEGPPRGEWWDWQKSQVQTSKTQDQGRGKGSKKQEQEAIHKKYFVARVQQRHHSKRPGTYHKQSKVLWHWIHVELDVKCSISSTKDHVLQCSGSSALDSEQLQGDGNATAEGWCNHNF